VLENNEISDLEPLVGLRSLTFLDLSGNKIGNLAPLSLLTTLTEIDLAGNEISNVRPLSSNLALTALDLAGNQIIDVSPLRFLRLLTTLDLADNQITGAGIEPLTGLSVLTRLDLSNNKIESIEALSQFAETTEVLLAGNPVFGNASLTFAETCVLHRTDATPFGFTIRAMIAQTGAQNCNDAAAALNSNPSLDLSSKMISDVRPVALVANLTSLNLASNAIVDAEPLTSMIGLATLNLSGNSIVRVDGLARLTNVTSLDLSGNPVDVSRFIGACLVRHHEGMLSEAQSAEMAVLIAFADRDKCLDAAETLKRATTVTLQNVSLGTVEYFPVFESAHRLNLRQNNLIDVGSLKSLSRVTSLNLSENQLTSLSDIAAMTSLETLNLTGNPITALNGITALQQLKTLLISNTQIGNVRQLASLPLLQVAQLSGLNITYTDIEDYCLVHRLDTFALLEVRPFMLAIEPRLIADGVDPKNCPAVANWARAIEALNLNKTNLASIEPVRFFANLRSLTMYDNRIRDAAPVRNLTRLETLNMAQNMIEAIPPLQSSVIKNLTLNQNRIGFVQTLQPKTSLVVLRLDNNRIRDARPLNNLANLTYLDLRSNRIETGNGVNGLFPRKPYLKGNPICGGPVILIFPPPPIVEACTREPNFGFVLNPGLDGRFILGTEISPHTLHPRPFRDFQ
jgi:Leucine-rich repeat (LRR) protein